MKSLVLILGFHFLWNCCQGQESKGNFLIDRKSNCTVWFKHTFMEDSVSWTGECQGHLASGSGVMKGYTNGKQTSKYIGSMRNGKPNGKGLFTFGNGRKLEGNFVNGEPLFLDDLCLKNLHKQIVSVKDSMDDYVGDNDAKELYYHAIIPKGSIKGAVILMPGTWETTEHLLSSMNAFCAKAFKNNLAVVALSINQRLALTVPTVNLINSMLNDAIDRYQIPRNKIVMGGWSMGGLFSLRYTELANENASLTAIKPAAVFSCDGPCDLMNIYNMFQNKLKKFPENSEAAYGINELKQYCGGTPEEAKERYKYYSCYSHEDLQGGNTRFLLQTPVRIYADVDANWWMDKRGLDMYYMNALDQSAMILWLKDHGNTRANFINAYQKGYRIEGDRHPHSWSIIEPNETIAWILECLR